MVKETTTYDCDSFMGAVEEGLKLLNHTGGVKPSSYLPAAPVAYAAAVSGGALIPLQIIQSSVKVFAEANPNSSSSSSSPIRVRFKATWHVEDQFSGSALTLAVPVGLRGTLVSYEMKVSGLQLTSYKKELGNCRPHSKNLYLLSLPAVKVPFKGGMPFDVVVNYVQDFVMIDDEREYYSFSVPLSIPSYVTLRREEGWPNEKIRVIFECRGAASIKQCHIASHRMIGIITGEKKRVFYQESDGYSNKDLECSFRVTSPTMGLPKLFHQETLFIRAVEEGLRLICGLKGTSPLLHSLLPTAPVLYAAPSNVNVLDIETLGDLAFQLPALVPLQMTSMSVKVDAEPKPDSVHIRFKGGWSVHSIKKGNSCPLVLAVPVGHRGCRFRCEIRVLPHGRTVKTEEFTASYGQQFQKFYLVVVPLVEGGADVSIQFHYVQDVLQQHGAFFFSVPLSVPSYANEIAGQLSRKEKIREKIRLTLQCKDARTITECDIPNYNMKELISDPKMRVFLQESLSYSSKGLTCSFRATC